MVIHCKVKTKTRMPTLFISHNNGIEFYLRYTINNRKCLGCQLCCSCFHSNSNRGTVVSHCGLTRLSSMTNNLEHRLIGLFAIHTYIYGDTFHVYIHIYNVNMYV